MKSFSTKPNVEQLDIEVDDAPVYVRQLSAGDKIKLSDSLAELASAASGIKGMAKTDDVEELGAIAASNLSKEQYRAWVSYMYDYVFYRWCNEAGERMYSNRAKFDALPSDLIEGIYSEAAALDSDVSREGAEKNS